MRNNHHIQELADTYAKENGYICASYLGSRDDHFIYAPRSVIYDELKCEDVPPVIVVSNEKASFVNGVESLDIVRSLKLRDHKRGRAIFKEFERKVLENDFTSAEEYDYIREIVDNQRNLYEVPVNKTALYDY